MPECYIALLTADVCPCVCCAELRGSMVCLLCWASEIKISRNYQGKKWTEAYGKFPEKTEIYACNLVSKHKNWGTFIQLLRWYCLFVSWLEWERVLLICFPNREKIPLNISLETCYCFRRMPWRPLPCPFYLCIYTALVKTMTALLSYLLHFPEALGSFLTL